MRASRRASIFAIGFLLLSCSDDGSSGTGTTTGSGGATSSSDASSASTTGAFMATGTGGACAAGTPCPGGVCDASGACCPIAASCGTECCDGGAVCSFLKCVVPGAVCTDTAECGADEFCDFSFPSMGQGGSGGGGGMCSGGTTVTTGKCMPKPPVCPNGMAPGDPPTCVTSCEYHPPIGVFSPEVKYHWGEPAMTTQNVMMSPIVVQLDDDNCDGKIDQNDIPEIVFFTFNGNDYNNGGGGAATLHAISIVGGQVVEKFAVNTGGVSPDLPGRQIAAGNIDDDPEPEIVVCTRDFRMRAYDPNGVIKWTGAPGPAACFMPSIADLDHDGHPEIVDVGQIVDGATGALLHTFPAENVVISDVMGDDKLEIVGSRRIIGYDGMVLVDSGVVGTHPAVGDLDLDGVPEIVTVDFSAHTVSVWHPDAAAAGGFAIVRQGLDINYGIAMNKCCAANPGSAGCTKGGGPPTIARFNADNYPDVGFAGGIGYVVFDGQKLMDGTPAANTRIWLTDTQDCSSAQTGSSVFDFDGDGVAEVVYADETKLHVYAGPTGVPLFEACNTSGTLFEYPLVADVDSDGHADIIVASNSYSGITCADSSKTTGVRVFGDSLGQWVRTRRIWNEHAYHVTNIADDGSVPTNEAKNYTTMGLNNFRQNVQPTGQFSAPDLVVSIAPICVGAYGLRVRVQNVGEAAVEPGVAVGVYAGNPPGQNIGALVTSKTLYPLGFEDMDLPLVAPPQSDVYAVVDDGMPPHPWHECHTDNNQSSLEDPGCGVPQ